MRLFASIGIVLLVVILQSHCQQEQDSTIGATPQNLDLVSRSVTNLAHKISLAIASPKSKTELFSPVSIAGALSLLLLGSGGATRDELINLLGFKDQPITFADIHKSFGRLFQELVSNDPSMIAKIPWRENDKCNNPDYDEEEEQSYQPPPRIPNNQGTRGKRDTDSHYISVANGVFLDQNLSLNPSYESLTKELYAGEISRKPLFSDPVQSSNEINRWVQEATRNKIREIVSPEQVSNNPMVLASALYFKAKWETMFIEPDTRPRPFYVNGRESPPVDIYTMATSGCFPFYKDKKFDVEIIGLPYQKGKSTMYIVMPNQSDRQKIQRFQASVPLSQVNEFIDRMVVKTGTILLPKMNLENTLGLKDVLISQGLKNIFNPYLSNLTEITKGDRILENVNRRGQPRPIVPTTRKQSTAKPTQSTQRTITQDFDNTNQRVPQTPQSIKPSQTPDVSSAIQPHRIGLNERECALINQCDFDGNICNCYLNNRVYTDNIGCYPKPWNIQQDCPPQRRVSNDRFCLADSHYEYEIGSGQCAQKCEQLGRLCYCCKNSVTTQQGTTSPPSPTDYQQNSNPSNGFEFANRFGQNSEPTPIYHQQNSNPSNAFEVEKPSYQNSVPTPARRPLRWCQSQKVCDYFNRCTMQTICPLVNQNGTPFAGNIGLRSKRQAQNNAPPPNLYVGDVLHKVTLDINEQGTEGGAVTAVVIDRISSSFHTRVDGPFLIYLRHDITKLPLFYGPVFDPRP